MSFESEPSNRQKKQPVSAVLVGTSGMGLHYLKTLLEEFPPGALELRAAVDPFPEKSERYSDLKRLGIPVFDSLQKFYESSMTSELVVISSPIHYHVRQSCEALRSGSNVLCEKPLGATVQEAEQLIQTRDESGLWVMIGYQWSYSSAIQALKRDILAGLFGKPIRLKTICLWPRDEAYYLRSDWAGKIKDKGNWVLDSPANNAMAHFLHNLFYVLGEKVDRSAQPARLEAELYKAYPIENFDSIACRVFTGEGTELLFYASHSVHKEIGPLFSFEFEKATVTYGEVSEEIIARGPEDKQKRYGSPDAEHPFHKLFEAVASVREPRLILCGPEAASSQTLCINGIQESAPEVITFAESMVEKNDKEHRRWVKGLAEALYDCYKKGVLPSEAGFSWSQAGKSIDLRNYRFFPHGASTKINEDRKS
jgi:predicted dehydrogenase